uniref:Uncharacterized protein n=1 Tax=Chenopodium quinoa TaxID=63459 RepID=A0A803MC21_CHEQI
MSYYPPPQGDKGGYQQQGYPGQGYGGYPPPPQGYPPPQYPQPQYVQPPPQQQIWLFFVVAALWMRAFNTKLDDFD